MVLHYYWFSVEDQGFWCHHLLLFSEFFYHNYIAALAVLKEHLQGFFDKKNSAPGVVGGGGGERMWNQLWIRIDRRIPSDSRTACVGRKSEDEKSSVSVPLKCIPILLQGS